MTSPFGRGYTGTGRSCQGWSDKEDALLRAFVHKCLPWCDIADVIPGRSVSACQARWVNHLRDQEGKPNPRAKMNNNTFAREKISADGEPIISGFYVFRVPDGDPYLQRLIKVHGKDQINRDFVTRKVA
jgi:hypothetical protein